MITGTYDLIVSALFFFALEWIKKARIQTQEKHTVGFEQTTASIDFRQVALKKEYWYDSKKEKKSSDSIK